MGMIVLADAMSIPVKSSSVQCVVTSPPYYGLRDYGTAKWEGGDPGCDHKKPAGGGHGEASPIGKGERDIEIMTSQQYFNVCRKCGAQRTDNQIGLESAPEAYVEKLVAVFREVRRVLRDDGTVWINIGDSYASGKGTCFNPGGGSSSLGKERKEAGAHPLDRGNKSTLEMSGLKPKDLIGVPWRVAFALQADGWYLRQDIIWHKPNPMPESVTDRCTKSHEYIFLLSKQAKYFYDAEAVKEPSVCAGESKYDNGNNGHGGGVSHAGQGTSTRKFSNEPLSRNRRSVWTITTKPFKEAHFATFPPEIPEICIKAGSKPGDTILDPFAGAGTTGVVAEKLGRKFIGLDISEQYCNMANNRIYAACGGLF
jgi:DNA modification methylase